MAQPAAHSPTSKPTLSGASTTRTQAGWTAGVGAEWAFAQNWTAKVEYLYVNLGNGNVSGLAPQGGELSRGHAVQCQCRLDGKSLSRWRQFQVQLLTEIGRRLGIMAPHRHLHPGDRSATCQSSRSTERRLLQQTNYFAGSARCLSVTPFMAMYEPMAPLRLQVGQVSAHLRGTTSVGRQGAPGSTSIYWPTSSRESDPNATSSLTSS